MRVATPDCRVYQPASPLYSVARLQRRRAALRKPGLEDQTIPIDLETVGEARIVAQALAGSQSAFEQIVRRYQRPIISLISRMTGDRALAEDLAQETFVKAFRSLAAFDTTRRLSSWLFRIAHNTAIDAMRRARPPQVPIETVPLASHPIRSNARSSGMRSRPRSTRFGPISAPRLSSATKTDCPSMKSAQSSACRRSPPDRTFTAPGKSWRGS